MSVYKAISNVQRAMAREGISKDRANQQQGYKFRGIDDVLNCIAPMLVEAGLCILPRVVSRESTERQTAKGGALFYAVVAVEYDLVSVEDGSTHTVKTVGEAMDSADKATNKAMSAAYKYMAIQTFAIPTIGDNDADATTHDVAPSQPRQRTAAPAPVASPIPSDWPARIEAAHASGGEPWAKACTWYAGLSAESQQSLQSRLAPAVAAALGAAS